MRGVCRDHGRQRLGQDHPTQHYFDYRSRDVAGHIYVDGDDITSLKGEELNEFRREKLGFIFQDFNLLDSLTAYENIASHSLFRTFPRRDR